MQHELYLTRGEAWDTQSMSASSALPHYFFIERDAGSYIAEMAAFVRCIQDDTPPLVTGLDGRIPVLMGRAALRSLTESRPVSLEEIDSGIC